jgi:hypothetical protein
VKSGLGVFKNISLKEITGVLVKKGCLKDTKEVGERILGLKAFADSWFPVKRIEEFTNVYPGGWRDFARYANPTKEGEYFDIEYVQYHFQQLPFITLAFHDYFSKL